jgi:hypothetical protein
MQKYLVPESKNNFKPAIQATIYRHCCHKAGKGSILSGFHRTACWSAGLGPGNIYNLAAF